MSWTNDVKYELSKLDLSEKSLRKFGITIGIIFLFFAVFLGISTNTFISILLGIIGLLLLIIGLFTPLHLNLPYTFWMGIAFVLGWFVSRFILTILFWLVLFPMGFIAKLFKKEFLNLNYNKDTKTCWVIKENNNQNYEKLY